MGVRSASRYASLVRCHPAPPSQRVQFVNTTIRMLMATMNTRIRHVNSNTRFQSSENPIRAGLGGSADISWAHGLVAALSICPTAARLTGLVLCLAQSTRHQLDDSISRATLRIDAESNPNLRCSAFKGADAPKVCMPITRPVGPI